MINVWITENNSEGSYCIVERADDRSEAIEALNEAILTDGVVPSWVTSVEFYERGDQPTETYQAGDTVE